MAKSFKFSLLLRKSVESEKGSGEWGEIHFEKGFTTARTAIVVCDMWDMHWCPSANTRMHALALKLEPFLNAARDSGIQIIHSPSDTMNFYRHYRERRRILNTRQVEPPPTEEPQRPPLPIDDSDEGCDTPADPWALVWTRQNLNISIKDEDVISDIGTEIYSFLRHQKIDELMFVGVHANKCILGRPFGIRQMSAWGISCTLLRDLTDAIYNPAAWPFVPIERATEMVVEYIEKYDSPTALSHDLLQALGNASN
jgi:nicotinamidase-related amidase